MSGSVNRVVETTYGLRSNSSTLADGSPSRPRNSTCGVIRLFQPQWRPPRSELETCWATVAVSAGGPLSDDDDDSGDWGDDVLSASSTNGDSSRHPRDLKGSEDIFDIKCKFNSEQEIVHCTPLTRSNQHSQMDNLFIWTERDGERH